MAGEAPTGAELGQATARLRESLKQLNAALETSQQRRAADAEIIAEVETLRADCARLVSENDSLRKQVDAAEAKLQSLQSRQADAADGLDEVIGRLRNVLAG